MTRRRSPREEIRALIPAYIAFRHELNAAEQENILRAQDWALRQGKTDLLTEKFLKDLQGRTLGEVWRQAGKYRVSARNIGIDHWLIPMELRKLPADTKALVEFRSCPADEIAVRFHHRLVAIIGWWRSSAGGDHRLVAIIGWWRFTRSRMATEAMPRWRRICWLCGWGGCGSVGKRGSDERIGNPLPLYRGPAGGRSAPHRTSARIRPLVRRQ